MCCYCFNHGWIPDPKMASSQSNDNCFLASGFTSRVCAGTTSDFYSSHRLYILTMSQTFQSDWLEEKFYRYKWWPLGMLLGPRGISFYNTTSGHWAKFVAKLNSGTPIRVLLSATINPWFIHTGARVQASMKCAHITLPLHSNQTSKMGWAANVALAT